MIYAKQQFAMPLYLGVSLSTAVLITIVIIELECMINSQGRGGTLTKVVVGISAQSSTSRYRIWWPEKMEEEEAGAEEEEGDEIGKKEMEEEEVMMR